jgi:hypothetical protein
MNEASLMKMGIKTFEYSDRAKRRFYLAIVKKIIGSRQGQQVANDVFGKVFGKHDSLYGETLGYL